MYTLVLDCSDLDGFTLADKMPSPQAMIYEDRYHYARCPYCGDRLLDFYQDGHPALYCWCRKVFWVTDAYPSIMGHRDLLRHIIDPDRIVTRRAEGEAA